MRGLHAAALIVRLLLPAGLMLGVSVAARADAPRVMAVKLTGTGTGTFRVDVTLAHADTGWQHYADKWQVVGPDGAVLGTRVLHHPHVDEQPFTRSLSGVKIPASIRFVRIRPHDKKHGAGKLSDYIAVPGREVPPKCRPGNGPGWQPPE